MRRPDPIELEFAFVAALIGLPLMYYLVSWLFALVVTTHG